MLRTLFKKMLPASTYDALRKYRKRQRERRFRAQGSIMIKCGDYEIESPKSHILPRLLLSQPYRDLCVGITAKFVIAKYPQGSIVDIGANIGDTAAMIATYAKPSRLLLVEASDYYYEILTRNASKLSGNIVCKKALVSGSGEPCAGTLVHWGGTAFFQEEESDTPLPTVRLTDIVDENTVFIKTDTDGFDFKILLSNLQWLANSHPAILFEDYITNQATLEEANHLLTELVGIGYAYFIVWDDPGFHMVSTCSVDVLKDLNRYLLKLVENSRNRSINNYDILGLHRDDADLYQSITDYYGKY